MSALCVRCERELADAAYVCALCGKRASGDLSAVAEMALAVQDTAERLSSGSEGGGSGKPGSRLPFDLGARSRLDAVEGSIYGWARHVAEERGVQLPEQPGRAVQPIGPLCRTRYECTHDSCKAMRDPQPVAPLLAVVAQWLGRHLDWLAHRQEAGEAFTDFAAAARTLNGVVRGPAEQRYLGPCGADLDVGRQCDHPNGTGLICDDCGCNVATMMPISGHCEGDVYGRAGAKTARCKVCGAEYDQGNRRIWLDDVRRDFLYHASEIADAYPIKAGTIRVWLARGLLVAHGEHEGRPLLKLGEVLDLAAGDAARREEARAARARRAAAKAAESEEAA